MAAPTLDNEFMQYWSMLTLMQKESLLGVAKNYVLLDTEATDRRTQLIEAERNAYLDGTGKTFSWEQVREMAVNKEKRNAF